MKMLRFIELTRRLGDWRAIRLQRAECPLCGNSIFFKFGENEHAVRCLRCRANPAAMCTVKVLKEIVPDITCCHVYELSSRGPLFRFLQSQSGQFTCSEFFDDVTSGSTRNSVQCQDVQRLTFKTESFDICTSTDVLEHVPDDRLAFREIHRVLRPGGYAVFTVPLNIQGETIERARIDEERLNHLLPPEYHHDHVRGLSQVLCFRNYGADILDRLKDQGFREVKIMPADPLLYWGYGRHVVVACR